MKVRFTQTRVVQDENAGTAHEIKYEAGRVYDLPEASARRWLMRGLAELADVAPASVPPEVTRLHGVKHAPGRPKKIA